MSDYKLIKERNPSLSPFEQILFNRGISPDKTSFFNVSWDDVNDPFSLENMEDGIDLLMSNLKDNAFFVILVDPDTDGFMSSALFINYLYRVKNFTNIRPVFHEGKMHGLSDRKAMEKIKELNPNLLIIPDASGTEEECQEILDAGIDILILDHHDTKKWDFDKNKGHFCLINNQHSPKYTNKTFSGVGITWQFCRALDRVAFNTDIENYFLDLVAVGNIGDMMSFRSSETRFLCQLGLKKINSIFLNYVQLTKRMGSNTQLIPQDVSFLIAPLINAVCRVGTLEDKEFLLGSLLEENKLKKVPSEKRGAKGTLVPFAEEGLRRARNAKSRQELRRTKLTKMIDIIIEEEKMLDNKILVLAFDDFQEEHRNLSGLVATTLCERFKRPVIVAFRNEDETYSGSLRAPSNTQLFDNFRRQCEESNKFIFASGHPQAAGVCFEEDKIDEINSYFNEKYNGAKISPCTEIDLIYKDGDPELVDAIYELSDQYAAWGPELDPPVILVNNIQITPTNISLLGQKKVTLKVKTPEVAFINFKSCQEEYNTIRQTAITAGKAISYGLICNTPSINLFGGAETPQLQFSSYIINEEKGMDAW